MRRLSRVVAPLTELRFEMSLVEHITSLFSGLTGTDVVLLF